MMSEAGGAHHDVKDPPLLTCVLACVVIMQASRREAGEVSTSGLLAVKSLLSAVSTDSSPQKRREALLKTRIAPSLACIRL